MSEGARLKEFRSFLGLSRKELAELLGRTYQTIKDLEDGKSNITIDHIKKLSKEYRLNPTWFLTGAGEMILSEGLTMVAEPEGDYARGQIIRQTIEEIRRKNENPEIDTLLDQLQDQTDHLQEEKSKLQNKLIRVLEKVNSLLGKI